MAEFLASDPEDETVDTRDAGASRRNTEVEQIAVSFTRPTFSQ